MQFLDVLRAMVLAVRAPWRLAAYADRRAATFFAVAVLAVTSVKVVASVYTRADPWLQAESELLTPAPKGDGQVDLSQPKRQFTAYLGGAVFTTIVSTLALAGLMMVVGRFLTDKPYSFGHAVIIVSSASSIAILGTIIETSLQLATHSMRWGPHLGIIVEPGSSPYMFAALQRVDAFALWEYLVVGMGLVRCYGLHHRYGLVVGLVVWLTTVLAFGAATSVASLIARAGITG